MEGRAAPTLPETFFSLYYNAIFKTHSRFGTIIGVSSMAAVFVIKEANQVLPHICARVRIEKGPFRRNIPQDSGGGPFSMFEIYDPKIGSYKKFINVVIISALKKSMNRLPTNGTTKYAVGAGPYFAVIACMLAIAFGVAPIPNPQKPDVITAAS